MSDENARATETPYSNEKIGEEEEIFVGGLETERATPGPSRKILLKNAAQLTQIKDNFRQSPRQIAKLGTR